MQTFARPLLSLLLAAGATALAGAADTPPAPRLPRKSPFEVAGGPAAPTAAATETLEFAGVTTLGRRTDLIFHDKTRKKNVWVGVGETNDGISVISYDTERSQAVVKINGADKVLTLRKSAAPAGAAGNAPGLAPFIPGQAPVAPLVMTPNPPPPAPVAAPAAPETAVPATPPATPPGPAAPASPVEIQRRQETEARMLVSDLLEIGMAQRRAYEEAQRKAAEAPAPAPAPADPPKP